MCIRDSSITIYYASGEYSCPAFDVNTFPMVYNIPDGGINVKMNDYVSVLNKASNYTEINELYPCIENVVIDIDDININIVSTDRNTISVSYTHLLRIILLILRNPTQ